MGSYMQLYRELYIVMWKYIYGVIESYIGSSTPAMYTNNKAVFSCWYMLHKVTSFTQFDLLATRSTVEQLLFE